MNSDDSGVDVQRNEAPAGGGCDEGIEGMMRQRLKKKARHLVMMRVEGEENPPDGILQQPSLALPSSSSPSSSCPTTTYDFEKHYTAGTFRASRNDGNNTPGIKKRSLSHCMCKVGRGEKRA